MPVRNPFTGQQDIQWVEVNIDEDTLTKIADTTGGKYFRATDTESLAAIYQEIDQLEKTNVEARHFVDYRELAIQASHVGGWSVPPLVLIVLGLVGGASDCEQYRVPRICIDHGGTSPPANICQISCQTFKSEIRRNFSGCGSWPCAWPPWHSRPPPSAARGCGSPRRI